MIRIALIGLLLILMSCNPNDSSNNSDDSSGMIETGLILNQTITINGNKRDYHIYVPDQPSGKPAVVLLHGNGELLGEQKWNFRKSC